MIRIKKILFTLSVCSLFFVNDVGAASISREIKKQEVEYYNEQIQSLTNLRDYYSAKALRYRNRANHFEYQNGPENLVESRKLKKQAEEYEIIVGRIEEELVKLHEKRDLLIEKNDQPPVNS
jgi:hypothetical protein